LILSIALFIALSQVTMAKVKGTNIFPVIAAKTYGDPDFTLIASDADSHVTYHSDNTAVAKIIAGKVHIAGAGVAVITANYTDGSSLSQIFAVAKADQTITFPSPGTATLDSTSTHLKAYSSSGLPITYSTDNVSFGVSGNLLVYIGTGTTNITASQPGDANYNPATPVVQPFTVLATWTKKALFGGVGRFDATSFSIGSIGYVGLGSVKDTGTYVKDFWAYDPSADVWTQKADYGGVPRGDAVGFSINGYGYVGLGTSNSQSVINAFADFWQYDPNANTWTRKNDFPGGERYGAFSMVINNNAYVGGGGAIAGAIKDNWEYSVSTDTWTKKAGANPSFGFYDVTFIIGTKGYMVDGADFMIYDAVADTWTNKGFISGRTGPGSAYDAYSLAANYDEALAAVTIGTRGYIFAQSYSGGNFGVIMVWEYDPVTNTFREKPGDPQDRNVEMAWFTVNNKAYLVTGADRQTNYGNQTLYKQDNLEFDPHFVAPPQYITFNALPQKLVSDPDFIPPASSSVGSPIGFTSQDTSIAVIVSGKIHLKAPGTVGITAYQSDGDYPDSAPVTQQLVVSKGNQTIAFPALPAVTVGLPDFSPGATNSSTLAITYTSSNTSVATIVSGKIHIVGNGTSTITASQAGNNNYNAAAGVAQTLTVSAAPTPVISANGSTTFVTGGNVILTANTGSAYIYVWSKDGKDISGATGTSYTAGVNGSYTVSIITGSGRVTSAAVVVNVIFVLPDNNFTLSITGASCNGDDNGSVNIIAKQNLNYTATITVNGISTPYTFTTSVNIPSLQAGTYPVCITVAGQSTYQQCYNIVITEPKPLSVYSTINNDSGTINLAMNGGDEYNILLNGETLTTTASSVTLPLKTGNNNLTITTDKLCQGTYSKIINVSGRYEPYPNPFQNTLNLNLGNTNINHILVEIVSASDGKTVYSAQYANQSGVLQLDLSKLQNGVYAIHLTMDNDLKIYKILKNE